MTDKTKQRIQELVPEVMELKFGCEIEFDGDSFGTIVGLNSHGWVVANHRHLSSAVLVNAVDVSQILGSPITLAVVLRAIEKANTPYFLELSTYHEELLLGYYEKPKREGYYTHAYWNLTKDYDDQSEETKAFIGKLLEV